MSLPTRKVPSENNTIFFELRATRLLKVVLLPILTGLVVACSSQVPAPVAKHAHRQSEDIRIGSYNVFGGAREVPETLKVIRSMNADVLAMQELSPNGAELLNRALKGDYPYRRFTEGVAIVSRYPLKNYRYQRSERGINGFIVAEVESPGGLLQVASLHLDPLRIWTTAEKWSLPAQLLWGQGVIHRAEVKQINEALKPEIPTVLVGDFNSASHAALNKFRKQGFNDSFAQVTAHPDRIHTLHFKLFGVPTGRRIDYILHDASFETLESQILPGHPSDHDVVVSTLSWKRRQ